jgi:hypothetical protein
MRHDPSLMLILDAETQARWCRRLKNGWARSEQGSRELHNLVKEYVLHWRSRASASALFPYVTTDIFFWIFRWS